MSKFEEVEEQGLRALFNPCSGCGGFPSIEYLEAGKLVNLNCRCGFEVSVHEPHRSAEENLLTAVNAWNNDDEVVL